MTTLNHIKTALLLFTLVVYSVSFSQTESARTAIQRIVDTAPGRTGAAVINLATGDTLTVNGSQEFPMQSVYKFPLALAVLHQVDSGKFSIDQKIHIDKSDLLPNTWSPLREKYPHGGVDVTLDELLTLTVAWSDNNGCDILFRMLGGPDAVHRYVHSLEIEDMQIVSTEEEMHRAWDVQYKNWSTPYAMARLLKMFYRGSILSKQSTGDLWNIMVGTSTGSARLKGKLPKGTTVGHKTGSSGTNADGITAAANDAGIVILPDGTPCVIVVFVSDSTADEKTRDAVIADIAKVVWDAYVRPRPDGQ